MNKLKWYFYFLSSTAFWGNIFLSKNDIQQLNRSGIASRWFIKDILYSQKFFLFSFLLCLSFWLYCCSFHWLEQKVCRNILNLVMSLLPFNQVYGTGIRTHYHLLWSPNPLPPDHCLLLKKHIFCKNICAFYNLHRYFWSIISSC